MELVIGNGRSPRQPQVLVGPDGNVVFERPRRRLSEEQIAAMAEGRRRAALRRRQQDALVKCARKYQNAIEPGPKSPTKVAASEKNPYVQFLKLKKEEYKGQGLSSREMVKKIAGEWRELKARGEVSTYKEQKCPDYFRPRARVPQIEEEKYGDYPEEEKSVSGSDSGSGSDSRSNSGSGSDSKSDSGSDSRSDSGSDSGRSSPANAEYLEEEVKGGRSLSSGSSNRSLPEEKRSAATTVQSSQSSRSRNTTPQVDLSGASDAELFARYFQGASHYISTGPKRRSSPPRQKRGSATRRRR